MTDFSCLVGKQANASIPPWKKQSFLSRFNESFQAFIVIEDKLYNVLELSWIYENYVDMWFQYLHYTAISINVVGLKSSLKTRPQCFVGLFFMNNFIKIIPARAGHCTANYNLLFSPGMTDFDEFINKNPT